MKPLLTLIAIPAMCAALFASEKSSLKVGDPIPAVTAPDQDGKPVDLAAAGSKGLTLVYFYPKADTPGCTKQGCSLRDSWKELGERGVAVYGVSIDSPKDQKAFKEKFRFPFPLIADEKKAVTKAFQGAGVTLYASRQAYLFENGACVMADHKGHTGDQAAQVIAFLDARKKDAPAK